MILEQMSEMTNNYFEGIFTADDSVTELTANSELSVITESQNQLLTVEVDFEEFTCALQQMHPAKASGSNGYSPAFFQHFWDLID